MHEVVIHPPAPTTIPGAIAGAADVISDAVQQPRAFEWTAESGWTLAIALIGLGLSVYTLVVQILRNRKNLVCELLMWNRKTVRKQEDVCALILQCRLVNHSKEAISVLKVALKYEDNYLDFPTLPAVLVPAILLDSLQVRMPLESTRFPVNLVGLYSDTCILCGRFPVEAVPLKGNGIEVNVSIYTNKGPVPATLRSGDGPTEPVEMFDAAPWPDL